MIVLDASAAIEFLLRTPAGRRVSQRILDPKETVYVPHLFDLEVLQVLGKYVRRGTITEAQAQMAIAELLDLPLTRYPHDEFVPRIWQLRPNFTAYDAAYIAVAERLGACILTSDSAFARGPGHSVTVELVPLKYPPRASP